MLIISNHFIFSKKILHQLFFNFNMHFTTFTSFVLEKIVKADGSQ